MNGYKEQLYAGISLILSGLICGLVLHCNHFEQFFKMWESETRKNSFIVLSRSDKILS